MAACNTEQPREVRLRADQPLVVLVHGCRSSGGRLQTLAALFEFHHQQVVCFNYNDRDSLSSVATRLRRVVRQLSTRLPGQQIAVVGHSQGGLIARLAFARRRGAHAAAKDSKAVRTLLVTISSPFSGIHAARHCGLWWLHVLSLGITVAVCQAIAGSNWTEIHPRAAYWKAPRPLDASVSRHLKIVTDERGTCRRRADSNGRCVEDDYVFSRREQTNKRMLADQRVIKAVVSAGHVEIVGEQGNEPRKLLHVLQQHGVLRRTPAHRAAELQRLLLRLSKLGRRCAPSRRVGPAPGGHHVTSGC